MTQAELLNHLKSAEVAQGGAITPLEAHKRRKNLLKKQGSGKQG